MIKGPITGGEHGWAFGRPLFDLAARGYVEEEFVLTGTATTYRQVPGTDWGLDGDWKVEPHCEMPFATRLLVYRPADPKRFNGTVVVCWNNVTLGYELFHGESAEMLEGGYAFVAASAQRAGVHGFPANPQGLAVWDPKRYGELSIPSDAGSYDIFAQIGRAVGVNRERAAIDPLGGLDVKRVVATGASQSAARLATYINAIHPLGRVFDGFMLQIHFGAGAPIQGDQMTSPMEQPSGMRGPHRLHFLRELDVPVMLVNSELEAAACFRVRQPDTRRMVSWEAAGATHVAAQLQELRNKKSVRDFALPQAPSPDMNRISLTALFDAALHHFKRWVDGGEPPPSQPRIELKDDKPTFVRDEHGIARGGARLPQVEAPVAANSCIPLAMDLTSLLRGSNRPFDRAKLEALYGDESAYLARFEQAAQRAVTAGVMLERDVAPAVEEAASEYRRSHAIDPQPGERNS